MIIKKIGQWLSVEGVRFFGETFTKLAACPDSKTFKNGGFFCIDSSSNIGHLIVSFPEAQWIGEAEILKFKFYANKKQEEEMRKSKDLTVLEIKDYPEVFKTKPFDHQLKAFASSKDAKSYGLFFEQGCGKTKVTIDTATYLFLNNKINALVIIAPNGVHKNWINDELPTHCKVDYESFCWEGVLSKKQKVQLELVNKSSKLKVYSFNVEAFISEKQQKMLIEVLKNNRCLFVIDESQAIKNQKAKRTKFFLEVEKKAKPVDLYKRILTGTPVTKGVEDLFSQLQFLNPAIIGLTNYYGFVARYCKTRRMTIGIPSKDAAAKRREISFDKIEGYQRLDELQDKLKTYTYRVLKKDCLDLPEKLYQREFIVLTAEQARIDKEIKEEGITFIRQCKERGEPITVQSILARMTKRQQIACGYMLNVDDQKCVEIVSPDKNPRLIRIREILDRIDGKVIIWARFTKDVDYIMAMLGDEAVRYDGQVDGDLREINKKRFQNDDSARYFVAKPIKGLTLTAATTAIYYSNDFDLEKRLQSEDRNHRFGTKEVADKLGVKNILYIDIEAENSIDKLLITALRKKKKVSDVILEDPESFFME